MPTAGPSRLRNTIQSSPEDSDEAGQGGPATNRPRRAAGAVNTYAEDDEEEEDDESMLLPVKTPAGAHSVTLARDALDSDSDELSDISAEPEDDGGDPEAEEDDELEDDDEDAEGSEDDLGADDSERATPVATTKQQRIKVTLRKSPASTKKAVVSRNRKPSAKAKKNKEDEEEADDLGSDDDDFANEELALPKTARQLARDDKSMAVDLQELPLEDSKKAKLTEAELALRRSEVARRRRNQTEKKLEDDKIETINRLLKKQVGRTRAKADAEDGGDADDASSSARKRKAAQEETPQQLRDRPRNMFRYVSARGGARLGVPVPEALRARMEREKNKDEAQGEAQADEDMTIEEEEQSKDIGPYWRAFDRAFGVTTEVG